MALMQIEFGSVQYEMMVKLRDEVLRKPLGLDFSKEYLAKDKHDILIGAFEDNKILACCILTNVKPHSVRLRQMAVANNLQHKGIGISILQFAETIARDMGSRVITMHARDAALGFYQKCGYSPIGEMFTEVTIPHHIMEKAL